MKLLSLLLIHFIKKLFLFLTSKRVFHFNNCTQNNPTIYNGANIHLKKTLCKNKAKISLFFIIYRANQCKKDRNNYSK